MISKSTPKRLQPVLLFCIALFCINAGSINAQPVITKVSPLQGTPGTTVTITGTGFGPLDKSIVRFGDVKAKIVSISATQVTVTVPASATYSHVEYTQVGAYTTFSPGFFCPTFNNLGVTSLHNNSFSLKTDIIVGGFSSPIAICAPDLDGDGRPDIALANLNTANISVYRNISGNGTDTFAAKQNFPAGKNPADIAYADFDHNGKLDLVVANYNSNTVTLYKNESTPGNIVLTQVISLQTDNGPKQIAIADFNRDGKPDIAVSNYLSGTVSIFRHGGGAFVFAARVTIKPAIGVYGIAVGDLDNDGKVDLVTANTQSNNVSVFKNNSAGTTLAFERKADVTTAAWPQSIAIGDFNQDGWADLVTANTFSHSISVLKNLGTAAISFGPKTDKAATTHATNVYASDVNGDGKVDIIVPGGGDGSTYIFNNTTTTAEPAFANRIGYSSGAYAGSVAITDIDGDGKPDMATADEMGDAFTIIKNYINGPIIKSFTPDKAFTAAPVTITGSGFTDVTGVYFGGVRAGSFSVNSQSNITATPSAGSSGNVTVTTNHGSDWLPGFTYQAYCQPKTNPNNCFLGAIEVNHTTYSAPTLHYPAYQSYFDQTAINLHPEGNTVTLNVDNHTNYNTNLDVTVYIDYNRNGVFTDEGEQVYLVSKKPLQASYSFSFDLPVTVKPGLAVIRFRASDINGGDLACRSSAAGGTKDYLVSIPQIPAPVVTSFSPASAGPGDTVTITGKHFTGALDVSFGGIKATQYAVFSSTKISAIIGAGASGQVSVSTPVGGTGQLGGFTYKPVTITGISPASAGPGDTVIITGDYLSKVSHVTFGGTRAEWFTVNSRNQVTAIVDTGSSGQVSVTSTIGNAAQFNGFNFLPHFLKITSFSPVTAGPGQQVRIKGSNFKLVKSVLFGSAPAAHITVVSANEIIATVGSGSSGNVSVQSRVKMQDSAAGFTYLNYCIANRAYSVVPTVKDVTIDTVKFHVPEQQYHYYSLPVPIKRRHTNTLVMTPVYPGSRSYTLVVWIDWNQDGSFDGENMGGVNLIAIEDKATGKYIFRFPIPDNALPGLTRVRMRFDAFTTGGDNACFSPTYGQVLDYMVVVPEKSGRGAVNMAAADESKATTLQAIATPNPTKANFKINIAGDAEKMVELRVMDISGKLLYHQKGAANRDYIFGGNFAAGTYFAQILQGTTVKTIKLVKVR